MEGKLKQLFDFQRFAKEQRLQALIDDTEGRYVRELTDEELALVAAAGETPNPYSMQQTP